MMRDMVGGGCGPDGANPLAKMMQGGAAAKARAAQLQGFHNGGHNPVQQMMMHGGPEVAELAQAEAMAAAFRGDMEAGAAMAMGPGHMMGGPMGPMMEHGGAFEVPHMGGGWANEFGGAMNPQMHQQAWAQEMMMQEAAMRSQNMTAGHMAGMMPLGAMNQMMGGASPMKGAAMAREARAMQMQEQMSAVAGGSDLVQQFSNVSLHEQGGEWGEEFAGASAGGQMVQRGTAAGGLAMGAGVGMGMRAPSMARMGRMGMMGGVGMGMGMYRGMGMGMRGTGAQPMMPAMGAKGGVAAASGAKSTGATDDAAAVVAEAGEQEEDAAKAEAEQIAGQEAGESEEWAREFADAREDGRREHGSAMSRALEEALNADDELAQTELRDFIAAINDGSFAFDSGSVLEADGGMFGPASMEEPLTARPYQFASNNPFLGQPDVYRTGVDLLQRGKVMEATRALEAAVQQAADNSDAWLALGLAHAENDEDVKAIIALNRAVESDTESLDALLALGVSHTNELEQSNALVRLRTWITKHPEYRALCPPAAEADPAAPPYALHNEVTDMFLKVVHTRPDDVELHTVLGVLYNLSFEYDKAIASFKEAIRCNPGDYTLWNKLGATMANSSRSQEAIDAYIQALELKPNYVRALANLGIAYSNQEHFAEAATCYLKALSLNPEARHIWSSLRVVFNAQGRMDLAVKCDMENPEIFRNDVDF